MFCAVQYSRVGLTVLGGVVAQTFLPACRNAAAAVAAACRSKASLLLKRRRAFLRPLRSYDRQTDGRPPREPLCSRTRIVGLTRSLMFRAADSVIRHITHCPRVPRAQQRYDIGSNKQCHPDYRVIWQLNTISNSDIHYECIL